jgi:ribonuclease HI
MISIYCDGGVIGPNPSRYGGTWCWCQVENNQIIKHASGIVTPQLMGVEKITNNLTELYAAVAALSSAPKKWNGTLHTDSRVTMLRLLGSPRFSGIPDWLVEDTLSVRKDKMWSVHLVAGHPTRKEMQMGFREKNGFPASKWNIFCDKECSLLAKNYMETIK